MRLIVCSSMPCSAVFGGGLSCVVKAWVCTYMYRCGRWKQAEADAKAAVTADPNAEVSASAQLAEDCQLEKAAVTLQGLQRCETSALSRSAQFCSDHVFLAAVGTAAMGRGRIARRQWDQSLRCVLASPVV